MNLPTGLTWKAVNTTVMEVIKNKLKGGKGEHSLD